MNIFLNVVFLKRKTIILDDYGIFAHHLENHFVNKLRLF